MSENANFAEVAAAGALTTVQDMGRPRYAALGWPECGAADKYSMKLANLLAGNGAQSRAAVLECTLNGASLRFGCDTVIAISGAAFNPSLDGAKIPMFAPVAVKAGQTLALGMAGSGLRGYIAVNGGWAVPEVMGSRSTDLKCRIGGFEGRALKKGDRLPLGAAPDAALIKSIVAKGSALGSALEELKTPLGRRRWQGGESWPALRCVLGPQDAAFTAKGKAPFARGGSTLPAGRNRMACKLTGEAVETAAGSDIISDGIVEGSVQIASDGRPIVMLADHQTTGGYAKIATVIPTDTAILAQLRPSDKVGFCYVSAAEAVKITRAEAARLEWLEEKLNEQ